MSTQARGPGGVRIAMWSGPRNISTALMRSWGSRPDTFVCDEPLYAHYLMASDRDHPGRSEILREHDADAGRRELEHLRRRLVEVMGRLGRGPDRHAAVRIAECVTTILGREPSTVN